VQQSPKGTSWPSSTPACKAMRAQAGYDRGRALDPGDRLLPLEREESYADLGADYVADRQSTKAYNNRLVRQLERLGHKVTLEPANAA
jgi:hypothetical protein